MYATFILIVGVEISLKEVARMVNSQVARFKKSFQQRSNVDVVRERRERGGD